MKTIAVFCGAKTGHRIEYQEAALQLAAALVHAKLGLIYGGTSIGIMGILADEVLRLGGSVIGVIPASLIEVEMAHTNLTKLHVVQTMQERKKLMMDLADGFITLPGGTGSMDEFFEVVTLSYLKQHHKPIGILNTEHYYDLLIQFMRHAVDEGFMTSSVNRNIIVETEVPALIKHLSHYHQSITETTDLELQMA